MIVADVWLTDAKGNVLVQARRLSLQAIDMAATTVQASPFYQWEWKAAPIEGPAEVEDVLILADAASEVLAKDLASALPGSLLITDDREGFNKEDGDCFFRLKSAGIS